MRNGQAVIVISFEDYAVNLGGVNKVIMAQQEHLLRKGYTVINVSPFHLLKGIIGKNRWMVRCDGKMVLAGTSEDVVQFCRQYQPVGIQIHHLKNINLEGLKVVLDGIEQKIYFYIHDFSTVIPEGNGNLLRDDGTLYDYRNFNVEDYKQFSFYEKAIEERKLFARYQDRLCFVAPSDSCKQIWSSAYPEYRDRVIVIYHQKEKGSYKKPQIAGTEKLKIAFVGKQSLTKGWDAYKAILERLGSDGKCYEFYSCGEDRESIESVKNIPVDFHDGLDAMTQALRNAGIDIVLLLSIWPETYSYTYYEGKAADAFVLAFDCSGNIADQICSVGNGKVFENPDSMAAYLKDYSKVAQDVADFRASEHTAPLSLEENDDFINLFPYVKAKEEKQNHSYHGGIVSKIFCGMYLCQEKLKKCQRGGLKDESCSTVFTPIPRNPGE